MAPPGPALCLFDVDGTLTAPRQVGDARRAGGKGYSQTGPTTPPQGGRGGAAKDRLPFLAALMSIPGDMEGGDGRAQCRGRARVGKEATAAAGVC